MLGGLLWLQGITACFISGNHFPEIPTPPSHLDPNVLHLGAGLVRMTVRTHTWRFMVFINQVELDL